MLVEKIDQELCTGCGICINSCLMDAIRMDDRLKKAILRYPDDCIHCQVCAPDCPADAIIIEQPKKRSPLITSWG